MNVFTADDQVEQPDLRRPDRQSPSPLPRPIQTIWRVWSMFTGPRADSLGSGLQAMERYRRSRLISALLVLVVLGVAILVPTALTSPRIWIPIGTLTVGGLFVIIFNRVGRTTLSALFFVVLTDGALVGFLVARPVLNSGDLTEFDLLILAVLVAGMVLPRVLILLTGITHIALIITIFELHPHDASLTQLIANAGGHSYTVLAGLILLQTVGTGIAWLHAWSVERALLRASRAEDLAAARDALNKQAKLIAEHNQRLEHGITEILEAHRQIAAGNLAARAPAQKENELWQIGQSLNILLTRFQQQTQDYRNLQQTQQEIEQVITALQATRNAHSTIPASFPRCRTPLGQRLLSALGVS